MSRRIAGFLAVAAALCLLILWIPRGATASGAEADSSTAEKPADSNLDSIADSARHSIIQRTEATETRHLSTSQARGGLRREPGVRVRVFAHDGSPAEGVPVAVLTVHKFRSDRAGRSSFTDSDGRAVLEMECPSPDARADRHRITAAIPLAQPCETILNWENYAEEHVLNLPPTGRVEVQLLDEVRSAYLGWAQAGIRRSLANVDPPEHMGEFRFDWQPECGATDAETNEGRLLFPWVGLGLVLEVGAECEQWDDCQVQTGQGPATAGETVLFRFGNLPLLTWLVIPVLDPSGAPLRQEQVTVDSTSLARGWGGSLRTDEDGLLTLVADPNLRESRPLWIFARQFTESAPWGAKWEMPVCAAGTRTRLPAIQLQEVPVLAAGVVLHADGRREPEAEISVYGTGTNNYGSDLMIFTPLTPEAGFIVHGFDPGTPLWLGVQSGWRFGSADLRPGALDHRLVLSADTERPAWLEWDDPRFMDLAELRIGNQEFRVEKDMTFNHWGYDGEAQSLEVIAQFTGEVLTAVPNVSPRPGSAREDARLRPLDLREKVRKVRVVWNPDQSVIPDWSIAVDPMPGAHPDFNGLDDRAVEFLTAREPLNLLISAAGHRPRLYTDVRGVLEVRLERATPVILKLADPAVLSVAPWIGCSFLPQFDSQGFDDTLLSSRFDDQGRATAWLPEAGEYLLYLQLAGQRGMYVDENHALIEIGLINFQGRSGEEIVIDLTAAAAAEGWQAREN